MVAGVSESEWARAGCNWRQLALRGHRLDDVASAALHLDDLWSNRRFRPTPVGVLPGHHCFGDDRSSFPDPIGLIAVGVERHRGPAAYAHHRLGLSDLVSVHADLDGGPAPRQCVVSAAIVADLDWDYLNHCCAG